MKHLPLALRIGIAVCLLVNAIIHFVLAVPFIGNAGRLFSQGDLFRLQGGLNLAAAILVIAWRSRIAIALAAVIAAGGLFAVVASVLFPLDLSMLGGPVIFEPSWYDLKIVSAVVQGLAVVGCGVLFARARKRADAPV